MIANPQGLFESPNPTLLHCCTMSGYNEKYLLFLYCNGSEQIGGAVWLYNI